MRRNLFVSLAFLVGGAAHAAAQCKYLDPDACSGSAPGRPRNSGQVCIYVEPGKTECRPVIEAPSPLVAFPFDGDAEITCDQGNLSPEGNSHRFHNTSFALDLATKKGAPAGTLLAGLDGEVLSYAGCSTENDRCGEGFGNHVRIFADSGVVLLYAHMASVEVKSGTRVKRGQVIGREGMTGSTGTDNRHLHLSAHFDWRAQGLDFWKPDGWTPSSIPFRLELKGGSLDSRKIRCRRAGGEAPRLCGPGSRVDAALCHPLAR